MIRKDPWFSWRKTEVLLILVSMLVAFLGLALVQLARQLQLPAQEFTFLWWPVLSPVLMLGGCLLIVSIFLGRSGVHDTQLLLGTVGILLALGFIMINRLLPDDAYNDIQFGQIVTCQMVNEACSFLWQQLSRGLLPGVIVMLVLLLRTNVIESIRKGYRPLVIGILGIVLLFATAFFGPHEENGAILSLKIGPLPAIQTSEIIKLCLVIFMAWFIENTGEEAMGRTKVIGWLQLPQVRYVLPGALFVLFSTVALMLMSDWGAILILGGIFVGLLYAGTEPQVFRSMMLVAAAATLTVGFVIFSFWELPIVFQARWLAFQDPWSTEIFNGETIAAGSGYQVQHALYATIAGGLTGSGLGFGLPGFVPVSYSDYILAALAEEMGLIVLIPIVALFALITWRILRIALQLTEGELFERMLLIGIALHLFMQVTVMAGGTFKAIPATGVTVPFLSLGGVALLVNLIEIGIVLALVKRREEV